MVVFKKDGLCVRQLCQDDAGLLLKWLTTPDVLEFYEGRDHPFNLERVQEKFYKQDERTQKNIVEFEGRPIGYLQFYKAHSADVMMADAWVDDIVYGMDQFIGEQTYWNQGLGTKLVKMMTHYLIETKKADRIILDPQVTNTRAIKCYEKCGFKKILRLPKHEYHEGAYRDCWLMTFEK